jgi:uncharacterized Tic20 family protein
MQQDLNQRKLLSVVCHAAIFLSSLVFSLVIPIVVLVLSEDDVVRANAKESINFHINVIIYGVIFAILSVVLIGIPLLVLLGIATLVMPIIAIVQVAADPSYPYRYPLIFRLIS